MMKKVLSFSLNLDIRTVDLLFKYEMKVLFFFKAIKEVKI